MTTGNLSSVSLRQARAARIFLRLGILAAGLLLAGCSWRNIPVIDVDGPIALVERNLLFVAFGLMLIVLIPVWVMAFWFSRHYREGNERAEYRPDWSYSVAIDALVWLMPALLIVILGALVWIYTHKLDPYRVLRVGNEPPLVVQAITEDWKWLFIYPEQNIAAVNELVIPAGRPVTLRLTSDTVMSAIYIPGLVGQIYTMAGMETRLNLIARKPDKFIGRNTQYSGRGFSDQQFITRAVSAADFQEWVKMVKQSGAPLDNKTYAQLAKPSVKVPVTYYSDIVPGLFREIIKKYRGAPLAH